MICIKMTKHAFIALAAVAGLLNFQPAACAAEKPAAAPAAAGERAGALRERMQETARELNLTPEQKEKLQTIVRERMEKLRDLRQDTSLSREEKLAKFKAGREEITAEVKKVLTPEQFEKWNARQGPLTQPEAGPRAGIQEAIKDLNLTETQKEQLKPIYQEQMEKVRGLFQDTNLSMAEKLEKLQGMQKDIGPKLKKVLDADQYAKWEKSAGQWTEQFKQRLQGGQQN
jgi:Spy/CpxP family protein refolding chaperone